MTTLFKRLFAALENCECDVETASLEKRDPDVTYSRDAISLSGIYHGRKFDLDLRLKDEK